MKRAKSIIIAMVMIFTMFAGIIPQSKVNAASTVTEIPITEIDDINYEAVDAKSAGDNISEGTASYRKQYQFTLKKPAYVVVSTYSNLNCFMNFSKMQYRITYDAAGTNVVLGTEGTQNVSNGDSVKEYLVLDAGTYYMTVWLEQFQDYAKMVYGRYDISVLAKYSSAITRNSTKAKAKTISTDKQNTGIITATTRNSWYKFRVSSKTTVNITTWLESEWGTNKGTVKSAPMATTLWNSRNKVVAFWNNENYGQSYTKKNVTLNPGTYYLSFYGNQYYRHGLDGFNSSILSVTDTSSESTRYIYNGGEIKFKITTIKAPISVKAVNQSGKKVKISYKKSAGAKGYEIQYSTKKNFKSGVKKLSTKGTSATIKKLTKGKTYYVRVRSWKYDMDYNKLYSSWVTKSVKIRK